MSDKLNSQTGLPRAARLCVYFGVGLTCLLPAGAAVGLEVMGLGAEGFGRSQRLLAVVSLLAIGCFWFARDRIVRSVARIPSTKHLGFAVTTSGLSFVVTLVAAEVLTRTAGIAPLYSGDVEIDNSTSSDWWVSDEFGWRFDSERIRALDLQELESEFGANLERIPLVNSLGYHDREFDVPAARRAVNRVLFLGDSFTWGATAAVGSSFVEQVRERLSAGDPGTLIWNAGIPATGTRQAVASYRHLRALMDPTIVVLGFYGNDFYDNLFPLDQYFWTTSGRGVRQYTYADGPIKISHHEAVVLGFGRPPSQAVNQATYLLLRTALGSSVYRMLAPPSTVASTNIETSKPDSVRETEELILELQTIVNGDGARLVVLLIPHATDLDEPGWEYVEILRICRERGIEVVEVRDELQPEDYATPDPHWNNSGHGRTGRLLASVLEGTFSEAKGSSSRP